jgi:nitrite reductase (NO-forming)
MKWSYPIVSLLILATVMFLFACTPQANVEHPAVLGEAPPDVLVATTPETSENFDAEFTLKTVAEGGKLAYIGVGGEIDGVINPDLVVQPGDVVRIVLVDGDGMPHDLFLPDWDVKSDYVVKIGDETEIVFEVGEMQPGSYVYYCTVPGHRQAGQEGKLVVSIP